MNHREMQTAFDRIEWRTNFILQTLLKLEGKLMTDLTALKNQVAESIGIETSALTLIQGLATALAAAGTDPAALAELQTQLKASADALAAAVAANPVPPVV